MGNQIREAAFEEAVEQMLGHVARDRVRVDGRAVDEGPTVRPMGNESARFHLAQHGGDRGVGEVAFLADHFKDIAHARFVLLPKHFHDLELKISQTVRFRFAHNGL